MRDGGHHTHPRPPRRAIPGQPHPPELAPLKRIRNYKLGPGGCLDICAAFPVVRSFRRPTPGIFPAVASSGWESQSNRPRLPRFS
eukprot:12668674-Alexandrium_andersonii.AAC.1